MYATLLLNADARPLSLLPISSVSWQNAIRFMCVGAAEPLHTYDDWEVHSPSTTIKVPSVLILKQQLRTVRPWAARDACSPQKHLVFLRDLYTCQYCSQRFARRQLTIDHVLPRFHGGSTRWENITTACSPCNGRRGHNMAVQPRRQPYRPTYGQLVKNMRTFPVTVPSLEWNYYLGWEADKVRLADPQSAKNVGDDFDFGINFVLECMDI